MTAHTTRKLTGDFRKDLWISEKTFAWFSDSSGTRLLFNKSHSPSQNKLFFYAETHKVSTSIRRGFHGLLHKPCHEEVHSTRSSWPLNQFENRFETGRQQKGARRRSASVRRRRAPLALPLHNRDCPGFSTTWPTSLFFRKPICTNKKIRAGKPNCKVSLGSARPIFICCWLSRLEREGCSNTGPGGGLPDRFHLVGKTK